MTLHRVAIDTYEVISPRNMHLGDDSVAKVMGIGSIVVRVEMRNKIYKIYITDVLHVSKL